MILNEGEVICDKCNRTGVLSHTFDGLCSKCHGKGSIDWVTNAMGEKSWGRKTLNINTNGLNKKLSKKCIKKLKQQMIKHVEVWWAPAGVNRGKL